MRLSAAVALCCLCTIAFAADPAHASVRKDTNIPAEGLGAALETLAKDYDFQVLYRTEIVKDRKTSGAVGSLTSDEALIKVLSGTGLSYKYLDSSTVTIVPVAMVTAGATTDQTQPSPNNTQETPKEAGKKSSQDFRVAQVDQTPAGPQVNEEKKEERKPELQEVVVTGTIIHNIESITPTITITGQEMIDQGYSRLDQVFDQLPQNFKGGASEESNGLLGVGNNNNSSYASGVNLRGLGVEATLVLLNGRRLANTAYGDSVDISSIPVSAIDRVEILTDGASAIYGSDAVAGVVNIITKRSFSGVETGIRSTGISEGKSPDYGGNILGGFDWSGGNFMINLDGEKDNALLSSNRSFEPPAPAPFDLLPEQIRRSIYASATQSVSDQLSVTSDLLFSNRTFNQAANCCATGGDYGVIGGFANQLAISLEIDYAFAASWNLKIAGQFSREKDDLTDYPPAVAAAGTTYYLDYEFKTSSVDAVIDGKLFDLPGGAVKAALGGEAKRESLGFTEPAPPSSGSRTSSAAYGELFVPIVGEGNAIPLVKRLNLDIAGRFDHYSDFGSTTNPKVALQWVPTDGLTLHGSYAKSFRAPELYQLGVGNVSQGYIYPVPNPASPTGMTTALLNFGSNPDLQPERADSYSAGITFKPAFLSGLKVDLSYFNINYKDRIVWLFGDNYFTNVITDADQLGPLVNLNPTLSQINSALAQFAPGNLFCAAPSCAPSAIGAIANIGYQNVGTSVVQGYDLDARYDWDTGVGHFFVDAAGTLMTENRFQITPQTVPASILNQYGEPLRFRAKTNLGWNKSHWGAYSRINFANAYYNNQDPNCPESPGCRISSWTTVDSGVAYTSSKDSAGISGGWRIAFDVMNLFNRDPPYANRPSPSIPLAYDPLNANPLLRTLAVSVSKKW